VGYIGRKFFVRKLWAPTAASPFLAAHLKSLQDCLPSQGADRLSMKKGDRRDDEEDGERAQQQLSAERTTNYTKG